MRNTGKIIKQQKKRERKGGEKTPAQSSLSPDHMIETLKRGKGEEKEEAEKEDEEEEKEEDEEGEVRGR